MLVATSKDDPSSALRSVMKRFPAKPLNLTPPTQKPALSTPQDLSQSTLLLNLKQKFEDPSNCGFKGLKSHFKDAEDRELHGQPDLLQSDSIVFKHQAELHEDDFRLSELPEVESKDYVSEVDSTAESRLGSGDSSGYFRRGDKILDGDLTSFLPMVRGKMDGNTETLLKKFAQI